ncbi:Ltb [Lemmus lemmus]
MTTNHLASCPHLPASRGLLIPDCVPRCPPLPGIQAPHPKGLLHSSLRRHQHGEPACLQSWIQGFNGCQRGSQKLISVPSFLLPISLAGMSEQGLGWEASQEEAFLRSGAQFSRTDGLALPQDGIYYLYCHVGYRGRATPADRGGARSLTLRSALYRAGGAYGRGSPELLLEGAETVTPVVNSLWYTSVGFGGLVQLRSGERVYVNISHPDKVDCRRGKTFFGAVMVG